MRTGNPIQQAGAIVLRPQNGIREVLLINSKKRPQVRIFPKGHVELGETTQETADRELMEEAGIKGEIIGSAGTILHTWNNKNYEVTYYLFNYGYNISSGEEGRDPAWFSPSDAYNLLPSDDLKELFRNAMDTLPPLV